MSESLLILLVIISPIFFILTAIASWFQQGQKSKQIILLNRISSITSILIVGLSSCFISQFGLIESEPKGIFGLGLSIRIDSLSLIMLGMIALLGFVIIKFSVRYLDGDNRQGTFMGRLAASIAAVQLLVLSGSLELLFIFWVLTSFTLHRLLVFYRERPGAQIAAKKKFIMARLGDLLLLTAIILLYRQFGSGNLEIIFAAIQSTSFSEQSSLLVELAALCIALAAILKSAQFPTHGWLIEVMETPTPVSALLHAGILNAGPFLILRMAFVMEASVTAPIILMVVGGLTAIFASVVYLTQTSVKTALSYSSVGHMGFSLMVCGMGVYPAALLHLVAHSFYKAHSFLSSGSIIDLIKANKIISMPKSVNPLQTATGAILSLVIFGAVAVLWEVNSIDQPGLMFIGGVIILGVSVILINAMSNNWSLRLIAPSVLIALIVTVSFFSLEYVVHQIIAFQVPESGSLGLSRIIVAGTLLFLFMIVVSIQIAAPTLSSQSKFLPLAIHIRNGFYTNIWFDRLIGAFHIHSQDNLPVLESTSTNQPFPGIFKKEKELVTN